MENLEREIRDKSEKITTREQKKFKKYLLFFILLILISGSFIFGYEKGKLDYSGVEKNISIEEAVVRNKEVLKEKNVDFSLFWKVWELLKKNHIERDKIDAQKLIYGAISGMLKATGDPYTDFFNPEESKDFAEDIEGVFDGIGAELGIKDDILTIIAPLDDSPAQKAGLRPGDKILRIDGKSSLDITIDQAVDLIRGEKGTEVKLTILHDGAEETEEISVIRGKIEIKSVKVEFKKDDIAYLKVIKFSDNVDSEFNDAINLIVAKRSKGIILDLRSNPGGLLDKTISVASRMIPKNKIVVSEDDGSGKKENLYTLGGDKISSIPTVVLINEGSASASEILAGALRDNQGITLIGKKSFGKGSVQQLFDLPGGSNVKITIAKWMTPNGEYIMEKGISPDVEVELTLDDYKNDRDPQLEKAIEVLLEKMQ